MKNRLCKKYIIWISLLLLILCLAACSAQKALSIANSDFEEGMTSSGGISGWQRYDYYGKMAADNPYTRFSLVDSEQGGQALCIENMQMNDARVYQHVDAKAGTNYKVTVQIKTENVSEEGAGANISVKDFAGTSSRVTGTKDWTTQTAYVEVWDGIEDGFDICLSLGGYSAESQGKAYFDCVRIEEVDEIPEQASSMIVWDPDSGKDEGEETDKPGSFMSGLFKVLFFAAIVGIVAYVVLISKKYDKAAAQGKQRLLESRGKPDKRDWLIMAIMTVLIAVVSFVNLGSIKAASNYWKAAFDGEYVVAEFEEPTHVLRYTYSSNIPTSGQYVIYYEDMETGEYVRAAEIKSGTFFEWGYAGADFTAKRIKVVAEQAGLALNEIAFFTKVDDQWERIPLTVTETVGEERGASGVPENLFDEQDAAASVRTYMNGTYFDELYFPRTAYEHIHGLSVYETTHPPLGKILISLGIRIFGMNPFGWRFMGTLFGVLLVPVMYLFALKIFKKRLYAFLGAFLMMFDFMRFSQSRLATIDTYSVLFVTLMYYFMYDYFTTKSYDLRFTQSLKPLAFCGLVFGLGIASKWTSVYAGAGLAFLFFLAKFLEYQDIQRNRVDRKKKKNTWTVSNFLPTCAACLIFFIVIPAAIYILSYIPYQAGDPDKSLLKIVWDNQLYMYNYHSNLNATHSFSSTWWQWPIMVRPIWYYVRPEAQAGMRSTIVSFGNPAVWWTGIAAVVASMIMAWKKTDKKMAVIFVAFFMQFGPWMLVDRCTFIYHFFTSVPFVILMIVYCIRHFLENSRMKIQNAMFYTGGVGFLLIFVALASSAMRSMLPLAILLAASSLTAYLLEQFTEKTGVRIAVMIMTAAGAAVTCWLMPCLTPVFAALFAAAVLGYILKARHKDFRGLSILLCYLALVLGLFISFYPVLSGMTVSQSYVDSLRWFGSWYF